MNKYPAMYDYRGFIKLIYQRHVAELVHDEMDVHREAYVISVLDEQAAGIVKEFTIMSVAIACMVRNWARRS